LKERFLGRCRSDGSWGTRTLETNLCNEEFYISWSQVHLHVLPLNIMRETKRRIAQEAIGGTDDLVTHYRNCLLPCEKYCWELLSEEMISIFNRVRKVYQETNQDRDSLRGLVDMVEISIDQYLRRQATMHTGLPWWEDHTNCPRCNRLRNKVVIPGLYSFSLT
jgi:hypothetical protein